jgi:hypothetical protein
MNWSLFKRAVGLIVVLLLFVALIATGKTAFDRIHADWRVPGFPVSIPLAGAVLLVAVAADLLFKGIVSGIGAIMADLDSEGRPRAGNK